MAGLIYRPPRLAGELLSVAEADDTLRVAFLSFDAKPQFSEIYQTTLAAFQSKCSVKEFTNHQDATKFINTASNLKAIIATDRELVTLAPTLVKIQLAIKKFVQGGGTLLFCCQAAYLQKDNDLPLAFYFERWWRLPWKWGQTRKAKQRLNGDFTAKEMHSIPAVMKVQAKTLVGVKDSEMVYSSDYYRHESAFVLGKYDSGFVGWLGDKNATKDGLDVALAMCGLHGEVTALTSLGSSEGGAEVA